MDKVGYKKLRTTIALLVHSKALEAERDAEMTEAVRAVWTANYALDVLDARTLECVSSLDEALTKAAANEYEFSPDLGSIRDHGMHVGTCALCGKGDSKGDGSNRDLLRYDFLLRNTAGGVDLWVGRTCIVKFGLRVAGAATAAEAQKILERAMRTHMRWWEVQAFRAANPDHADIPAHARGLFQRAPRDRDEALRLPRLIKQMRRAASFYARTGRLTALKLSHWQQVKALIAAAQGYNAAQQ